MKLGVSVLCLFFSFGCLAMPQQYAVLDPRYAQFREKAREHIDEKKEQCAKFINRLFLARFGKMIFGDAWTMQLHPDNQRYLNLLWRLPEAEISREKILSFKSYTNRIRSYQEIYRILDSSSYPVGVMGTLYYFSPFKKVLAKKPSWLPQTHVSFISGKSRFEIVNNEEKPQKIREILTQKYGIIHDYEVPFLLSRIKLNFVLKPGEIYSFTDYLLEEHFRGVRTSSLLEFSLQKHKNGLTPILSPVSFSLISDEIIAELEDKKHKASIISREKIITEEKNIVSAPEVDLNREKKKQSIDDASNSTKKDKLSKSQKILQYLRKKNRQKIPNNIKYMRLKKRK